SLRVMRGMASLEALAKARQSWRGSRIVRLFERSPAAAVAFGALSPVPDWITRSLAAVSGYHPARYVVADTLGRLPKLWIPAAAGGLVSVDPMLTRVFLLSQIVLVGGVVGLRWHRSRRRWRTSVDCTSGKAVVPFAWAAVLAAIGAIAPAYAQSAPATAGAASLVVVEFGGASINGAGSAFGGLHFTRLVPRKPGFDVGLQVHRFFREDRNDVTALAFDFGTAYRLPTARTLDLVPGLGLSAVGTSDGGAGLGLNASAHLVWRIGRLSLRGGGLVRGLMGGPTVMASGSLGMGFTP
ncbi:MAG TPA: hypothetical protein VFY20_04745, partial [Gemmatimonadales bacterium]|nr:hypothetical protein [Gemmatimonadales bacterium]